MAYRLKEIHYETKPCNILLQNENGPCPLLAAVNCLLLKGTITLPSNCIGAGVVTIDQLVNVLAEKILSNQSGGGSSDHHIQEVLTIFPTLQYGMDVNPKFTGGPNGVEYTMHLNAFDLLHIELVHGWLLDPDAEEYELIGNQTYNQLVNVVIEGNDASTTLQQSELPSNHDELSTMATKGSIVKSFLDRSASQLTQYGLTVLHEYLRDGQMVVFFRNNHFNTLTKHDGLLYLLVTDLGYAKVPSVVWEKLDVIDGDTEYVAADFKPPSPLKQIDQQPGDTAATGEQLLAHNLQSQSDYQLALQLSRETSGSASVPQQPMDDMEAARLASLNECHGTSTGTPTPAPATSRVSDVVQQAANTILEAATSILPNPAPPVNAAANTPAHNTPTTVRLPPPPAVESSAAATQSTAPVAQTGPAETVAVGVPASPPSQEQQDLMLAMQLQRQEENQRMQTTNAGEADQRSLQLAREMEEQERANQQRHVSRPGAPPSRLPTAPTTGARPGGRGKDSNCVIS